MRKSKLHLGGEDLQKTLDAIKIAKDKAALGDAYNATEIDSDIDSEQSTESPPERKKRELKDEDIYKKVSNAGSRDTKINIQKLNTDIRNKSVTLTEDRSASVSILTPITPRFSLFEKYRRHNNDPQSFQEIRMRGERRKRQTGK